jgi:formylglycine-generating enzyme required for sulfatase activity
MARRAPQTIALVGSAFVLAQLACSMPGQCQSAEFAAPAPGQLMEWTGSSGLVYIPEGSFVMGRDEEEPSDHSPAHTVTVNDFWIFQVEVTNRMYRMCVDLGVCTEPTEAAWYAASGFEEAPASGINWDQAKAYCEWIGGRLPTEAEWELAARGTDTRTYPWGEDEPTCDLLNFLDCLEPSEPDTVGSYPLGVSPFKVADMAGNVSEWVSDWYAEDYYAHSPASNPTGPETGEERIVRGSSYLSPLEHTRIVLRSYLDPLEGDPTLGFRCVVDPGSQTMAPMCSVLTYEPIWDPSFTARPSPAGQATNLGFYCSDGPYKVRGIVKFDFDIYGYSQAHPLYWSPAAPAVSVIMLPAQPDRVEVAGDAIQPGSPVTIEFCFVSDTPQPLELTCPHFYQYDPGTGMCKYDLGYGGEQCPGGIVVEGYGCLPSPVDGQCPAGFYSADYNGQPVCVPTGGPICLNPDRPPAVCPEGLVLNEGSICCESPRPVSPTCPSGFTLDAGNAQCVPEPREWCTTISDGAPLCEPTPTPRVKPSCASFGNQTDCQNAGCTWRFTSAGAGFCAP